MYKDIKISCITFSLGMFILLSSCIKEEFDPKKINKDIVITPTVAAPIGYIHYELNEVLKNSGQSWNAMVDETGLVSLYYEEEIISVPASEIFQFPEISHEGYFANVSKYPLDLSRIRYPYSQVQYDTLQFVLSGPDGPHYTDIDSIRVESMLIEIFLSPKYELTGKMIVSSPDKGPGIYKTDSRGDRIAWGASFPIPRINEVQTIIVEDVTIIPFNDSTGMNRVPLIFEMRLGLSKGIVPVDNHILNYIFTIKDLDYSSVFGYLGRTNFHIDPQSMAIDFYNSINGTFHFAEPWLKLNFENSFGLPVQVLTDTLYVTDDNGNSIDITGNGLPSETNIKIIHYPDLNDFGKAAFDSLIIPHDGANFKEALDIYPSSMTFGFECRTNTQANDTDNFITDQSRLTIKSKFILPLYGYTELVIVQDSLIFDFSDFFKHPPEEIIPPLTLRLNFTNGFPVDISTQIYLADSNQVVTDSIFEERQLILAGTDSNGDGIVDDPWESDPVEAELSRTKIDHLAESRYFILNGRLATSNYDVPVNIRFYSDYFLDAFIGVVGDLELNSTGN
jgi:hypothetical protein